MISIGMIDRRGILKLPLKLGDEIVQMQSLFYSAIKKHSVYCTFLIYGELH